MPRDPLPLPVIVKRHGQARRMSLRIEPNGRAVVLVLPPRVSEAAGMRFLHDKRDWITNRLAVMPRAVALAVGDTVPVRGVPHQIRLAPARSPELVRAENGVLWVAGPAERVPGRVKNWLKIRARDVLARRARHYAAQLDCRVASVTVRDPKSRWGSCTAQGALSFSWRLILAPPAVLDYVAAHEAAHLVELNHSDRFWTLVEALTPDLASPRHWLRRHGAGLHLYG